MHQWPRSDAPPLRVRASGFPRSGPGHSRKARHEHEVAERELRAVAMREAGRAVMCRHYGGVGTIEVWRNSAKAVGRGEAAWIGTFRPDAVPGSSRYSAETQRALGIVEPPTNWPSLCRLAGVLAGLIGVGVTDRATIDATIAADCQADGDRGPGDSACAAWCADDVERVDAILRSRWQQVEDEVEGVVDDFKKSRRGRVMFKG